MKLQRSKPWTRLSALCCALMLLTSTPVAMAADAAPAAEIDHALLWGHSIDQVSNVMAMKLGFQVRPGRNPDGIANRYVRFADRSYVELFGIERPDAVMDPGMQADQASLHGGPGARTFGLRSSNLEGALALLRTEGFAPTPIFTASPDDPDGDGPSKLVKQECCKDFCGGFGIICAGPDVGGPVVTSIRQFADDRTTLGELPTLDRPPNI